MPCHVPSTLSGIFKFSKLEKTDDDIYVNTPLNDTVDISNGQVVEFSCENGYNVQGPTNMKCWHGEWTVTSLPDCTAGKGARQTFTERILKLYSSKLTVTRLKLDSLRKNTTVIKKISEFGYKMKNVYSFFPIKSIAFKALPVRHNALTPTCSPILETVRGPFLGWLSILL